MNFSIILASRERIQLLDSLLSSITSHTSDKNNCEVICVLDTDDRLSRRFLDRLKNTCPFAKFVIRDRADNLNDDYLNWAWKNYSTGDNIIVVNDDVVFKTPNWDHIAMAYLSRYFADKPDGIAYGWIQDGLTNRQAGLNYCCFPLITRKAAEIVGFVMPPQFPGWGADLAVYRIYAAVNRICEMPSVVLEHISYHNGGRERDHISHNVERRSVGTIHPIEQFDINPYVDNLLRYIGGDPFLSKSNVVSGATITNATITDVTIVGGKIIGGKIECGMITGGRIESGIVKNGVVSGDFQTGFITGFGDVQFSDE